MLNYFFIKRWSGIAINIEISKNNGMLRCKSFTKKHWMKESNTTTPYL
jgi:hypothetical protein